FMLVVSDFIIDYLVVLNKNGESAFYCGRGGKEKVLHNRKRMNRKKGAPKQSGRLFPVLSGNVFVSDIVGNAGGILHGLLRVNLVDDVYAVFLGALFHQFHFAHIVQQTYRSEE